MFLRSMAKTASDTFWWVLGYSDDALPDPVPVPVPTVASPAALTTQSSTDTSASSSNPSTNLNSSSSDDTYKQLWKDLGIRAAAKAKVCLKRPESPVELKEVPFDQGIDNSPKASEAPKTYPVGAFYGSPQNYARLTQAAAEAVQAPTPAPVTSLYQASLSLSRR